MTPGTLTWNKAETPKDLQPMLEALGEEYPLQQGTDEGISLRFTPVDGNTCGVALLEGTATITYSSPVRAARALGTLLSGLVAPGNDWEETSPFTMFGIMLDCSRNAVIRVSHLKRWLRRLALLGYNMVMLYTEDTYELDGEPFFGFLRGAYTADELQELDAYAANLGIEMIPCIQTLGHMSQALKWPAYYPVKDDTSVLLVDEPQTYALIEKMIKHWSKVFRTRRIHVGMDETHTLGRGRFLDQHGYEPGFEIFNRHLGKVVKLCEKHGLKPMIWSDMYFRFGSKRNDCYDKSASIPKEVVDRIPPQAELVYWDYYHEDKAFYREWIERHRRIGHEPLMGSGVWVWTKFWHDRDRTESAAGPCIEACKEAGLKELFFTMWRDDGAYCDVDSGFAGLTFTAEKAFSPAVETAALKARFRAVCGGDYDAVSLASDMNARDLEAAMILWDDPLLGTVLQNKKIDAPELLAKAGDRLRAVATSLEPCRTQNGGGCMNHAWLLASTLADKVCIADRLYEAYAAGDREALAKLRREASDMVPKVKELAQSLRDIWMTQNKPFGLEVLQIRFGGLATRYEELARRLDDYLAGRIDIIEELAAGRPGEMNKTINTRHYRFMASPSSIL